MCKIVGLVQKWILCHIASPKRLQLSVNVIKGTVVFLLSPLSVTNITNTLMLIHHVVQIQRHSEFSHLQ